MLKKLLAKKTIIIIVICLVLLGIMVAKIFDGNSKESENTNGGINTEIIQDDVTDSDVVDNTELEVVEEDEGTVDDSVNVSGSWEETNNNDNDKKEETTQTEKKPKEEEDLVDEKTWGEIF